MGCAHEVRAVDLPANAGLKVLAGSAEAGLCLIEDRDTRAVYMFNYLEYDAETLRQEFFRDRLAGKSVGIPANYFPDDDPARPAMNVWRPAARLLFGNWLDGIQRTAWTQDTSRRDTHLLRNGYRAPYGQSCSTGKPIGPWSNCSYASEE